MAPLCPESAAAFFDGFKDFQFERDIVDLLLLAVLRHVVLFGKLA